MNTTKFVTSRNRLLPALHGLRGLAASAVVLFHLHHINALAIPYQIKFVGTHFGLGVQLFFVLSAFSLFYSTISGINNNGWVRDYFLKRFFRIAPLFYVMLITWILFFHFFDIHQSIKDVLLNILFVFNFVPGKHESIVSAGWTIGVEMIFYALIPVLVLTIGRVRHAVIFFIVSALISFVSRAALEKQGSALSAYANLAFISYIGVFAAGILAFWCYRLLGRVIEKKSIYSDQTNYYRFFAISVSVIVFLLIVSPLGDYLQNNARSDILLWAIFFGSLVFWQSLFPSRFLSSNVMTFLGERSYSIYLLHPFIIYWLTPINKWLYPQFAESIGAWAFLVNGTFTLAVVFFCAEITYRLIEVPSVRAGQKIISMARRRSSDTANDIQF